MGILVATVLNVAPAIVAMYVIHALPMYYNYLVEKAKWLPPGSGVGLVVVNLKLLFQT